MSSPEAPTKTFTNNYKIYMLMRHAMSTRKEVVVEGVTERTGEPIRRSSLSMYVSKIKAHHFAHTDFYTRSDAEGRILIGLTSCATPAQLDGK